MVGIEAMLQAVFEPVAQGNREAANKIRLISGPESYAVSAKKNFNMLLEKEKLV